MSPTVEEKVPSYEKINYRVRPAKSIERKMLCESFRKLSYFSPVQNYRYIGFGSPFFADFTLIHKQLGIDNMISIEKDIVNKDRFEFNKPYRCIEMKYGMSNVELPGLEWGKTRDIIWLDYDGHLDTNVLNDINTVFFRISSGSIVTITVNVNFRGGNGGLGVLRKCLEDNFPEGLVSDDIQGWLAAGVCRDIMFKEISKTIKQRNQLVEQTGEGEKFQFKQLYNINYSDGAKMLTFGGIVYSESEEELYNQCNFDILSFVKTSDKPFIIDVPSLTYKEIRSLDSQLPNERITDLELPGVKEEDIKRYSDLYKHFPAFSETEL